MDSITLSTNQLILVGVCGAVIYVGRKFLDGLFDNWLKKTQKNYVTEEMCVERRKDVEKDCFLKRTEYRKDIEKDCEIRRTEYEKNTHDAMASLKPILQKLVKSDVKNRKILHLVCTKLGIEEKIIASLINGDDDDE